MTEYVLFLLYSRTNISIVVTGVAATQIADYCLHHNRCKKSTVRRIGGLLLSMSGIYFVLLGTLPCYVIDKVIVALLVLSSLRSGTYISLIPFCHDISPTYQETLYSLRFVAGNLLTQSVPIKLCSITSFQYGCWFHSRLSRSCPDRNNWERDQEQLAHNLYNFCMHHL